VNVIVTTRDVPQASSGENCASEESHTDEGRRQIGIVERDQVPIDTTQNEPLRRIKTASKTESYHNKPLNQTHPRLQLTEELPTRPSKDILLRARDLGMKIWPIISIFI
jgi:hypothetical protein